MCMDTGGMQQTSTREKPTSFYLCPPTAAQGGRVPLNAASSAEIEKARTAHDALSAMLAPPQVRAPLCIGCSCVWGAGDWQQARLRCVPTAVHHRCSKTCTYCDRPLKVGPLVEALVAKYVALSQEELEEWQSDPEGYIRSLELEAAPDADTPRPVGVGLLLCMLERGGEGPGRALIDLAARLQVGRHAASRHAGPRLAGPLQDSHVHVAVVCVGSHLLAHGVD